MYTSSPRRTIWEVKRTTRPFPWSLPTRDRMAFDTLCSRLRTCATAGDDRQKEYEPKGACPLLLLKRMLRFFYTTFLLLNLSRSTCLRSRSTDRRQRAVQGIWKFHFKLLHWFRSASRFTSLGHGVYLPRYYREQGLNARRDVMRTPSICTVSNGILLRYTSDISMVSLQIAKADVKLSSFQKPSLLGLPSRVRRRDFLSCHP